MMTYIFDGTFEGLLSAIYQSYSQQQKPEQILSQESNQESLFEQKIYIETIPENAEKVCRAVKEKISFDAMENIIYAFLSEAKEIGTWIYHYLDFGWKVGSKLDSYLDHEQVLRIHNLSRRVQGERHRMLGLIRFRRLGLKYEVYYAPYAPDSNITGIVAPHFIRRLSDQNWIIHDVKRSIAAVYNQQEWFLSELTLPQIPPLAESEIAYQTLWKQYHQSIAITTRTNLKLQKQNMPMKYWSYLVEKN